MVHASSQLGSRARQGLAAASVCASLSLAAHAAHANPDGRITGRSQTGCGAVGNCHGVNPGATTVLAGPTTVTPGARSTFTITIRSTFAGFVGGGFDIAVAGPAGTALAANPAQTNTRVNGVDLVMNARIPASGGAVTASFDVVTPAAGAVTIFASGNATNGSASSGDAWALGRLAVTVAAPVVDAGMPQPDVVVPPADVVVARDVVTPTDVVSPRDVVTPTDVVAPRDVVTPTDVVAPRDVVTARDVVVTPTDVVAHDDATAPDDDAGLEHYDPTNSYGYGTCDVSRAGASSSRWPWALGLALLARRRRRSRDA